MGVPEWIAVISIVVALLSLALQQHLTRQQSKSEARDRHYDRTQTLLLRALGDPDLLDAISGTSEEHQRHRRYRQLWFNHIEMFFRNRHLFDKQHWKGTMNYIRGFMNMPAMVRHWKNHEQFYADDFRSFMNKEVLEKKAEPTIPQTPPDTVQASTT